MRITTRLGHAAILVQVPDRGERDHREPGDLEDDQRERLRRRGRWRVAAARSGAGRARRRPPTTARDDPARPMFDEKSFAIPMTVSSWIRIVPTYEAWVVRIRTTPDQMSSPASVTTNDGTPAFVITSAWRKPIVVVHAERGHDRGPPGPPGVVRTQEERHHDAADRAHERHGQVDLPDQEHEDDADRDRGDRGHLQEEVGEVALGEERLVEEAEDDDDDDEADDDRQRPELAGADSLPPVLERTRRVSLGAPSPLGRRGRKRLRDSPKRWDRRSGPARSRVHLRPAVHPGDVPDVPAVIACTTSCCVVFDRSSSATRWPSRSTVIRSAHSKTSWRLWEMITTPRPRSARRRTRSSTWRVWATPRAAVGSSRMTSFESHMTDFATATACR